MGRYMPILFHAELENKRTMNQKINALQFFEECIVTVDNSDEMLLAIANHNE